MANNPSAKKRIRQIAKITEIKKSRMSKIRTIIKKFLNAIHNNDKQQASEIFRVAQAEISRGAQKSLYHSKTASRKISRLSAKLKAISS